MYFNVSEALKGPLQNCEKRLLLSSRLFALMGKVASQWTDFQEFCYLTIFQKSFENVHV
jgi:hypothetical protein